MYAYSQLGVTIVIYLKYLVIVSWFDFASLYNTMDSVPNSYIFEIFSYCVSVWICQSLRHNGQCARFCVPVHLTMQWRWKGWEHAPHTNGQSSPGYLHSVQQPSKGNLQIAHNSSFASHVHEATACHSDSIISRSWWVKKVLQIFLIVEKVRANDGFFSIRS